MNMLPSVILSIGISIGCILAARILYHYFQLESYQFPGYFKTIRRNLLKAVLPGATMAVLLGLAAVTGRAVFGESVLASAAVSLILIAGGFAAGKLYSEKKAKKPFVFTPRVKRLYAVSFIVLFILSFFLLRTMEPQTGLLSPRNRILAALVLLFPAFLPCWVALCGLLAWPLEKLISEMYFQDARRILRSREDLIRIGITGSWGKTSVKFILGTLLEEKYHTLVTPASYNTPMGVTKVIRSRLEPSHRVFVAEMGARHVGDIREMCRLVRPQIGILTSVGPQHLDTFKTIERVTKTKYELIEALPEDGFAAFADDDGICLDLFNKTSLGKLMAGMHPERDDVWAEEACVTGEGSTFYLCTREFRQFCTTRLLGELNIRNILLCAGVCLKLGMSGEQIARGIGKIQPVEHRLQLIANPGGLTVIDDAFNSNIRGAKQAFDVLKEMKDRRILITPGMVELGDQEAEMNREFGRMAAGCCDIAVLIGKKRSESIAEGLKEKGFPDESVYIAASLDEATELLKKIAGKGDTVLFENDLPDHYTE